MEAVNYLSFNSPMQEPFVLRKKKNGLITVFIVDDNEVYLTALEAELKILDYVSVYTFKDGNACLKNMLHEPDLVILDYHLGEGNDKGDVVLERIKKKCPDTEVIIVSGDEKVALMGSIAGKLRKYGASSLLTKQKRCREVGPLKKKLKAIFNRKAEHFAIRILIWIGLAMGVILAVMYFMQFVPT